MPVSAAATAWTGSTVRITRLRALRASAGSTTGGTVLLRVTTAEGAIRDVPVKVTVTTVRPKLTTSVTTLEAGMLRGEQRLVQFLVTNTGGAATGPLQLDLPEAPWLQAVTGQAIDDLLPGASATVILQLTPTADLPLGAYTGALQLVATQPGLGDVGVSLPFTFRNLSSAVGDLQIEVVDEFTYFAEGAPRVANAEVVVRDAFTGTIVFQGTSNSAGLVNATALPEGYYTVRVTAADHGPVETTTFLAPGILNPTLIFLARESVRYTFTVEPTGIADRTRLTVETVFETNVPAPVIAVDPPVFDFAGLDVVGDRKIVEVTITNHGLIAANNMRFDFGENSQFAIRPLVTNLGTLDAKSSMTVPVVLERIGAGDTGASVAAASDPCAYVARLLWELYCAGNTLVYNFDFELINAPTRTDCGTTPRGGGGGGATTTVVGPGLEGELITTASRQYP